jgi:tetratricopeptide (TPR) repeat protein
MKSNNPTAGKKSSKPAESASRMVELWAAPGIVALSTFLVFLAALDNGFVDWDDDKTITENPHFRGLGWNQLGLGVLFARQGMREEALPYLRKAAASSPGDSQIRYDLAIALATTSELEEAVEHFSATVRRFTISKKPSVL